ncbi:MAG: peptide chain release factor 2, partial [Patescibacteria group bacterium]
EWGSQIRNYVLHPYKKIKDVRSGWETNSPADLLEYGELMEVIWSVKRARKKS